MAALLHLAAEDVHLSSRTTTTIRWNVFPLPIAKPIIIGHRYWFVNAIAHYPHIKHLLSFI